MGVSEIRRAARDFLLLLDLRLLEVDLAIGDHPVLVGVGDEVEELFFVVEHITCCAPWPRARPARAMSVRDLATLRDRVAHGIHQHIHEVFEVGARHARLRAEHVVVASDHQALLEANGKRNFGCRAVSAREQLKFRVELREPVLDEEKEQVESDDRTSTARVHRRLRVERSQLRDVSLESLDVARLYAQQRGNLKRVARHVPLLRRGRALLATRRQRAETR